MTQAVAPTKVPRRSVPLEVTPEARPLLTPFRERTFRAMHEAAIVRRDSLEPRLRHGLTLFCEVDATWRPCITRCFARLGNSAPLQWPIRPT